jgi:long-chain acyl-CoA synthetase
MDKGLSWSKRKLAAAGSASDLAGASPAAARIEDTIFARLSALQYNDRNRVVYFEGAERRHKTFRQLWGDVDLAVGRLRELRAERVGLLGPSCYNWLVLDLACIFGGMHSVAFPELLPSRALDELLCQHPVDVLFVFRGFEARVANYRGRWVAFGADDVFAPADRNQRGGNLAENRVRADFTTVFSSGSTGVPKPIPFRFRTAKLRRSVPTELASRGFEAAFGSGARLWRRRGNRLLIFMPFSHLQQRQFALRALILQGDIIIANPNNCLVCLIRERPNVIIAVPAIYEAIASLLARECRTWGPFRRGLLAMCNRAGVNRLGSRNPLRRLYDLCVTGPRVTMLYGGRADVFISGSAPIDPGAMRALWNVGVRVFDVYSSTELGVIAANTPSSFRLGSVGRPMQDIRIAADGEIMVRFDDQLHDRALVRVSDDGYAHTGDLGQLDRDGFLYYRGRVNSVIVLANGKKVSPEAVELNYRDIPGVEGALIVHAAGRLVLAVVLPKEAPLKPIAAEAQARGYRVADFERPAELVGLVRSECPAAMWTTSGKIMRAVAQTVVLENPRRLPLVTVLATAPHQ